MYDSVNECYDECQDKDDYGTCMSRCLRRKTSSDFEYAIDMDEAIGFNY